MPQLRAQRLITDTMAVMDTVDELYQQSKDQGRRFHDFTEGFAAALYFLSTPETGADHGVEATHYARMLFDDMLEEEGLPEEIAKLIASVESRTYPGVPLFTVKEDR